MSLLFEFRIAPPFKLLRTIMPVSESGLKNTNVYTNV